MNLENVLPMDIEKRSFEIITEELGELKLDPDKESIIKRCIHTAADFDYARTMRFSDNVVEDTLAIMKNGGFTIVTDTKMAQTGINKAALAKLNGNAVCFMSDPDVAARAKEAEAPVPPPAWRKRQRCRDRSLLQSVTLLPHWCVWTNL